jgi:hypothetical protein
LQSLRQLALFVKLLGPFSENFAQSGADSALYFHPNSGTLLSAPTAPSSIRERLAESNITDPLFEDFLRTALVLDPAFRPNATVLLRHPWLT